MNSDAARVLIADDEPLMRDALALLLAAEGFDVVGCAVDGYEAVVMARRLDPDVVLMDLRMPNLGGIEAAAIIRAESRATQVIMLTAYDDPALANIAAHSKAAFAYLVKGCPPAAVLDLLRDGVHRATEVRVDGKASTDRVRELARHMDS
jgi:DNA-binding NarL/FixJ family response regulator